MTSQIAAEQSAKIKALWLTVIVETAVLLIGCGYNIYEVRRTSTLLQAKLNSLAEFSAAQGEKLDRMTTLAETYLTDRIANSNPQVNMRDDSKTEPEKLLNELRAISEKTFPSRSLSGEGAEKLTTNSE